MFKRQLLSVLIIIMFLIGCSQLSKYDNSDVAAIVNGEEIRIGDLRFLHDDKTALDYLDGMIMTKLIEQEVKNMNLETVTIEGFNYDGFAVLPPKNTKDKDEKQIRQFAKKQAKKFDITAEQFQEKYAKRLKKQNEAIATYLKEKIEGYVVSPILFTEEHAEEINLLLQKLREESEIEIVIQQ